MKVGDIVTWKSQSSGTEKQKTGLVFAVISPGRDPSEAPIISQRRYNIMFGGNPRNHESYLILVGGNERQYGALYWPRVKHLELVAEA